MKQNKWIMDGNYNSTLELRFLAADLVIFLDINSFLCIISVLKRHGKKRSDLPDYLEEKIDSEFFEFCRMIWNFHKTGKKGIIALHNQYPQKPFLRISSRRYLNKFLSQMEKQQGN